MIMISTFLLLGLATFRLTRLFVYDQITEVIRTPFHDIEEEIQADGTIEEVIYIKGSGIRKFVGELLSCHWCTGVWSATLLYMGYIFFPTIFVPVIIILALAAIGSIIQVFTDHFH